MSLTNVSIDTGMPISKDSDEGMRGFGPKEKWRWTWCEDGIWAMFTEILRRLGKDKVPRCFDDFQES